MENPCNGNSIVMTLVTSDFSVFVCERLCERKVEGEGKCVCVCVYRGGGSERQIE